MIHFIIFVLLSARVYKDRLRPKRSLNINFKSSFCYEERLNWPSFRVIILYVVSPNLLTEMLMSFERVHRVKEGWRRRAELCRRRSPDRNRSKETRSRLRRVTPEEGELGKSALSSA